MDQSSPFAPSEYEQRLERVRQAMQHEQIDILLITAPESIYYVSGYQTKGVFAHQYLAVPQERPPVFMTRWIELSNLLAVLDYSPITDYATYNDDTSEPVAVLVDLLRRNGLGRGRIGVEKRNWYLLVDHYEKLQAMLPDAQFVDASSLVERVRLVKSPAEIEYHRQAGAIAVQAMQRARAVIRPGIRDSDVAAAVLDSLLTAGSEWVATWPNICVGQRTGLGHATWQHDEIVPGDPVTVELGGVVRRYHSPLWRTFLVAPWNSEYERLALAIREANQAGVAAVRPGIPASEVHRAMQSVMARHGYGELAANRLGYSVGIGFPPTWAPQAGIDIVSSSQMTLAPGMVFHVLTSIIEPNKFGMGQSSTVVVTEEGSEDLTAAMEPGPIFLE